MRFLFYVQIHLTGDFYIIKSLVRRDNMTEKEFEQRIDAAADRFEKTLPKNIITINAFAEA